MLLPPDFVRHWEGTGLQRPYCFECIRFAHEMFTARGVCWEFGAYVSIYSSCGSFERRCNSSTPIIDADQTRAKYKFGLNNLV